MIDTDDADVQIEILQKGKIVKVVEAKDRPIVSVRSGNYEIRASSETLPGTGIKFEINPRELTINRGGQQVVKVAKQVDTKPGKVKVDQNADGELIHKMLGQIRRIEEALDQNPIETKEGELAQVELAPLRQLIRNMKTDANIRSLAPKEDSDLPVYRGRSFAQWLREYQQSDITKMDPEVVSTLERMFWSGEYRQQSDLATLLAQWKVGDEELVKKLAHNFYSPPNNNPSMVPLYAALTSPGFARSWGWVNIPTEPTVGWHDKFRVSVMLRMLERLADGKPIRMRYVHSGGGGNGGIF